LAGAVDVDRCITERLRNMRCTAGYGESTGSEKDPVQSRIAELTRDALDLEGLIPRRAGVNEDVAKRTGHKNDVTVVMNARQPHDLHGLATHRPDLKIPKPGGCG
tara:strand:+ start:472 stop:786 length:315 start_codon:yes stop_codon:yes gene_type:complete